MANHYCTANIVLCSDVSGVNTTFTQCQWTGKNRKNNLGAFMHHCQMVRPNAILVIHMIETVKVSLCFTFGCYCKKFLICLTQLLIMTDDAK